MQIVGQIIYSNIIKKIRKIQIVTSRMVTNVFAGQYQSAFKGKGIEFGEVREYYPGDDIRFIDWNVTARTGRPHVKKFVEERELTVMFLLDISPSCCFGTVNYLKSQLAAELCSLLSFAAVKNNDKIGLILFTDRIEKFIPPQKGIRHVLRIVRDALYFKPEGKGTNISLALEYVNRVFKRRTVTFLLSDFYSSNFKNPLSIANKRHDIVAITINDPIEMKIPNLGMVNLWDAETGKSYLLDTSDSELRKEYDRNSHNLIEERKKLFRSINVDHIDIATDVPYLQNLIKFFGMRKRRLRF